MNTNKRFFATLLAVIVILICSCTTSAVIVEESVPVIETATEPEAVPRTEIQEQKPEIEASAEDASSGISNDPTPEIPLKEDSDDESNPAVPPAPGPEPEPDNPEPTPPSLPPEPAPEIIAHNVGDIGEYGGPLFQVGDIWYELGEATEASSWNDAKEKCSLIEENDIKLYRLPTVTELLAIYEQLFDPWLWEIDETYYWSCEEDGDASALIVNFSTGFTGSFFKDMDFLSAMFVREI